MKVLFAVSNENTSQAIIKKYQAEYKKIISYKNVYYFNAILKELQRDKTYDRVVISEDLEQYVNTDYEQMDKFLFDRLDSISDEASNAKGEDIPIILICTERRNKSEPILVKLFGIGVYNAILGNDRSASEVCRLINRPRSKKEAKLYYKIDADDVKYGPENENDVSELEIQNILSHYKRIGNDEEKYVESFESIASQYNDIQLRIISKCLPLSVRAVLEEKSPKYQQVNSYNNKISDTVRVERKKEEAGTSEILLENSKTKRPSEPVVIPSEIGRNKKKILTKITADNVKNDEKSDSELSGINIEDISKEEIVQPVKRGRGRPRKNAPVQEVTNEQTKRKRGRPKKVVEELEEISDLEEQENTTLSDFKAKEETEPLETENITDAMVLPGFENNNEEPTLPGFTNDDEETILPGFEEEEEITLPDLDSEEENDFFENKYNKVEEQYTSVLNNLRIENDKTENSDNFLQNQKVEEYAELDIDNIIKENQKLVAFVGTSKNGTSFLVNNVAEILSLNGIDTAILDLTKNRNAYYIYTKNEERLRNQSNYIMKNLKIGKADGIQEHKNLTIYTSPFENDENLEAVEPIIQTLLTMHTVVLMDCDFSTPMKYFKYAQEIYLIQSMDILTIQPLTAFVRQLADKEMFEERKARVVLNKFIGTKEISEEILIGGISIYNDASMTLRKELFNRKTVPHITIPFDLKSYLRYLDGLVICDVSLKGYTKDFIQCLQNLASMVYRTIDKKNAKYTPPSIKNNNKNNGFSPRMNNTLNQMKQNY